MLPCSPLPLSGGLLLVGNFSHENPNFLPVLSRLFWFYAYFDADGIRLF